MQVSVGFTGNLAVATALKQINPDVCAAYPITPSTEIVMLYSDFVANGEVDTKMITVESEHSAMSACIGASLSGGRVFTATSSAGLAYMWEMLAVAAGMRTTIVLASVNRALSAPLNIHCDHSDAMGARDSGWIQIFAENAQEAYDNVIQAFRIGEHPDVRLPVMSCMDGFIISHSYDRMKVEQDDAVIRSFVGEYTTKASLLDFDNPVTMGTLALPNSYIEFKRQQREAMEKSRQVILDVGKEFGKTFGREYGFFETHEIEDAEIVFVVMSSAAGTTKHTVNELRKKGKKVGVLKPRVFRPFPAKEIADALGNAKVICILDRAETYGGETGPLGIEVKSALQTAGSKAKAVGRIFGLGQRELQPSDIEKVYAELESVLSGKDIAGFDYIGVRQ